MPIYAYACKQCDHTLDALQKIADDPLVDCPECGESALKRLLSAPRFRLKGKGMPVLRSSQHGDLYIQVTVETPMNLTKKQRKLLEEFQGECTDETSPESTGFFARVKDFLNGANSA